jgi:hypothetical protein
MFLPGQMVLFPMMDRGGAMGLRRSLVELRSSLMRILWHVLSFQPTSSHVDLCVSLA